MFVLTLPVHAMAGYGSTRMGCSVMLRYHWTREFGGQGLNYFDFDFVLYYLFGGTIAHGCFWEVHWGDNAL